MDITDIKWDDSVFKIDDTIVVNGGIYRIIEMSIDKHPLDKQMRVNYTVLVCNDDGVVRKPIERGFFFSSVDFKRFQKGQVNDNSIY